jgi:hypothetical protein
MIDRMENLIWGLMRVFVALVFVAGISWGVALTAAQMLGVPQSRVIGVLAVVGLIAGLGMLNTSGKGHSSPSTPNSLLEPPSSHAAQPSPGRWRELRDIETCRREGLISEQQARDERARILGPQSPDPR